MARAHLSSNVLSRGRKFSDEVEEFAIHDKELSTVPSHQGQLHQEIIKSRLDSIVGSDRVKSMKLTEGHTKPVYEYIDVSFVPNTGMSVNTDHFEGRESGSDMDSLSDNLFVFEDANNTAAFQIPSEMSSHGLNAPIVTTNEVYHDSDFKTQDSNLKSHFRSQYELALIEILSLLKIPFCQSSYEAESQCAFLNESNLVDYVISDDSDVFLFGNVKVIRSFYKRDHSPQLYSSKSIEKCLSLSRIQLIIFAMLVGCDYTSGVKGIGVVKALSIVREIKCDDIRNAYDEFCTLCDTLRIDPIPRKEIYTSFAEPAFNRDLRQFKWQDRYDFSELKFYLHNKIGMDPEILKGL